MSITRRALTRTVIFGGLWLILTGADSKAWGLSLVVVAVTVYASLRLAPGSGRLRMGGTIRFLGTFLSLSVRGGFDVALRAFGSQAAVDPGVVSFATRLPAGSSRLLFAAVVGLVPGSVGAGLEGNVFRLHVLDRKIPIEPILRILEARLAGALGIELAPLTDPSEVGR